MASQLSHVACRVSSAAAGGLGSEDAEDWLLTYLASTSYGRDPRLNVATARIRVTSALLAGNCRKLSTTLLRSPAPTHPDARPRRFSLAVPLAGMASCDLPRVADSDARTCGPCDSSADGAQPASATSLGEARDRSILGASNPRVPLAGAQRPQFRGLQAGDLLSASDRAAISAIADESESPSESFDRWVATGGAQRSRRLSMTARTHPASDADAMGAGRRSMQVPRMSMSGRRQSMDYSELDAVRERLSHAASLWALQLQDTQEGDQDEDADSVSDAAPSPSDVTHSAVSVPSSSSTASSEAGGSEGTESRSKSRRAAGHSRHRHPSGGSSSSVHGSNHSVVQGFLSRWMHKGAKAPWS